MSQAVQWATQDVSALHTITHSNVSAVSLLRLYLAEQSIQILVRLNSGLEMVCNISSYNYATTDNVYIIGVLDQM